MRLTRRQKKAWRLLQTLNPAPLNLNRGRLLREKYVRPNRKDRRHSGRKYPKIFGPQKVLDEEGIFVDYYWDDWSDYRDSQRDTSRINGGCYWDNALWVISLLKKKLLKQKKIRKARKRKIYKYINLNKNEGH